MVTRKLTIAERRLAMKLLFDVPSVHIKAIYVVNYNLSYDSSTLRSVRVAADGPHQAMRIAEEQFNVGVIFSLTREKDTVWA